LTIAPPARTRRAARPDPARGLLVHDERAADVGAVHAVEVREVELGQRREQHDPGRMDHDVDAAVELLGTVEQGRDLGLVRDVRAEGLRGAAGRGDRLDGLLRPPGVARVVDDDPHAVRGQPLGDRAADPARGAGDDRDPRGVGAAHGALRICVLCVHISIDVDAPSTTGRSG
jgi:hypothetical protein